jgi:hypothetical protein
MTDEELRAALRRMTDEEVEELIADLEEIEEEARARCRAMMPACVKTLIRISQDLDAGPDARIAAWQALKDFHHHVLRQGTAT